MTGALTPPRVLVFDWDNTLVDTWPSLYEALRQTFEAMDVPPWSFEEFRVKLGPSLRDSFPELFGDRWKVARDVFYDAFAASHLQSLTAAAGAAGMLDRLVESGLFLGVVSNKTGTYLRREVAHLGWEPHFGRVVGAQDAPRDKPAPDPVNMVLAAAGVSAAADVWLVGDAGVDMECAANAGVTGILLRNEAPRRGEFDAHPPARHVPDCPSLAALIAELSVCNDEK